MHPDMAAAAAECIGGLAKAARSLSVPDASAASAPDCSTPTIPFVRLSYLFAFFCCQHASRVQRKMLDHVGQQASAGGCSNSMLRTIAAGAGQPEKNAASTAGSAASTWPSGGLHRLSQPTANSVGYPPNSPLPPPSHGQQQRESRRFQPA
eukprot:2735960-Prymnesium_polylepis.1